MVSPLNLSAIISLIKKSGLKGANPAVIISRGLIKIFETTATAGDRKKTAHGSVSEKLWSLHGIAASQPRWGAEKVLDQQREREESQRCKWQIKKERSDPQSG